jgi:hypothetical protein
VCPTLHVTKSQTHSSISTRLYSLLLLRIRIWQDICFTQQDLDALIVNVFAGHVENNAYAEFVDRSESPPRRRLAPDEVITLRTKRTNIVSTFELSITHIILNVRQIMSTKSSTPYAYLPLEQDQIRLLTLLPGKAEDHIQCLLEPKTLNAHPSAGCLRRIELSRKKYDQSLSEWNSSSPPQLKGELGHPAHPAHRQLEYEALSYMWSPKEVYKSIDIDGSEIPVRRNLWQALYHLRYSGKLGSCGSMLFVLIRAITRSVVTKYRKWAGYTVVHPRR